MAHFPALISWRHYRYRYYNKANNTLDINGFIEDVLTMPRGSLIVHNP
jgi:aspartate/tyrosine/aromatic aminotransferase